LLYRAILLICFHKQKEVSGYVPINESRHLTYFLSSRATLSQWPCCQGAESDAESNWHWPCDSCPRAQATAKCDWRQRTTETVSVRPV